MSRNPGVWGRGQSGLGEEAPGLLENSYQWATSEQQTGQEEMRNDGQELFLHSKIVPSQFLKGVSRRGSQRSRCLPREMVAQVPVMRHTLGTCVKCSQICRIWNRGRVPGDQELGNEKEPGMASSCGLNGTNPIVGCKWEKRDCPAVADAGR